MDIAAFKESFPLVYSIIVFAIILFLTWLVEHIVFKIIKNFGKREHNPLPSSTIFANIARVFIWLAGIAIGAKAAFDFDLTGVVAALGVGGIALSLGLQDTLQNLIGGLQVSMGKLVEPGDFIEVGGQRGQVVDINWRHTVIQDQTGPTFIIPNSVMNKNSITRLGISGWRNVPFQLPVNADLESFKQKALEALERTIPADTLGQRGIQIRFAGEELGLVTGKVMVDTLHAADTPSVTIDMVTRAIEPALKAVGGELVADTQEADPPKG